MTLGRYLVGVAALLCVLGSLGVGASVLRRHFLPDRHATEARLAEIVIACALMVGMMEALGTLGLFRLVPIVVLSIVLGVSLRVGFGSRGGGRRRVASRPVLKTNDDMVLVLASAVAVVVVLLQWTRRTLHSFAHGITGADSIGYHLPHAAFYAQTGQTRAIPYTDFDYLTGLYPATSELFHALGIVLMGNDVLSPAINLVWLAFALLAGWCIGSLRGVGAASTLGVALVLATPMLVGSNAGTADNDVIGLFFAVAAVALWVRVADLPASEARAYRAGTALAAVAAGLALSVKVNLAGPVCALLLVAIAFAPSGRRRGTAGWWLSGLALGGGYWYVRNLAEVGNPLPWFSFDVLPTPRPPPFQDGTNYSLADYAGHPGILGHWLIPALGLNLGPWWPALVAAAVVGPLVALCSRRDRVVQAVALIALASLVAYPFTPLTACGPWGHPYCIRLNVRYGAPALTLALAVTPMALLFRSRRGRLSAGAGLATLFAATLALRHSWPAHDDLRAAVGAAVLVAAIALAVGLRPWPPIRLPHIWLRAAAATLALSLVVAAVALGYSGTRDYLRHRYAAREGPSAIYKVWHWARGVHHARIAFSGTLGWFFGYPIWGVDDSNRVAYMGHHGRNGSFRPIPSCRAWRAALNRGHYRYVVTTANRIFFTTKLGRSPEAGWTRSDPAARLVLSPNRAIEVFRITGPLDPDRC